MTMEDNNKDNNTKNENEADPSEPPQQTIFDLKLFHTLSQAQNAHGVPLQDYAQYHEYCTKRLHRIRHHKDVRSQLVHSTKYRSKAEIASAAAAEDGHKKTASGGGRHGFCPRSVLPKDGVVHHEYTFWNVLFQAERAWGQACALQTLDRESSSGATAAPKTKKANLKGRILARLNKAVHWARVLQEAVEGRTTNSTQHEVRSYLEWMLGNQQLQRREYAKAFRHYSTSRKLLLQLASGTHNEGGNAMEGSEADADAAKLALQDMWTNRADDLLLPLIRFCQYEAKDEDLVDTLDEDLNIPLTPKNKKDKGILLEFRGHEIALDSYADLAVLYLKLEPRLSLPSQDNSAEESDGGEGQPLVLSESQFLQDLSDLDSALNLATQEAKRYDNLPDGPAVLAKRRELASIRCFFQYHKLSLQRQHQEDQLAAGEQNTFNEADAAEMLHVYEALLQTAQAMVELNQLDSKDKNDDDDYNPEDDPYWLEAQAHVVRLRALRCFQLARVYESPHYLAGTTSSQVLALLQQCTHLQKRAVEEVGACDFSNAEEEKYQLQLEELKLHTQAVTARVAMSRFLEEQASEASSASSSLTSKATNRPLWLRLKDLDSGSVLADQDPSPLLMPIPCKPVFYDVAWEHVTDTSVSTEMLEECIVMNEPKKNTSSGGLFSWFSS